jgi:signal transduction histidine kinase/CheY-like chemotaxis protein
VKRSGRLFRKYLGLIGGLAITLVLAAELIEGYFSYEEQKISVATLAQEKASAAAIRIGQFGQDIATQMAGMTLPQLESGEDALMRRRFEFRNLLRQVPAITDIRQLDRTGREQLLVSRLERDTFNNANDFSKDPAFLQAQGARTYFGPVHFRRQTEPYMTVAVAGPRSDSAIAVAEVNLGFIRDAVSQIRVGKTGQAYVVDSDGRLIAHPDLSLVLRNTNYSDLAQVKAALGKPTQQDRRVDAATVVKSAAGGWVLAAHSPIAMLGWTVFVEEPVEDALAPLYASLQRKVSLLLLALAVAVAGSYVLARRMVAPITALETGAQELAAGVLDHRVSVHTGDELETLADRFNHMADRLHDSHSELEHKVARRTLELELANRAKSRFLAVASHDLRQPMHALGLFSSQLSRKPLPHDIQRLAQQIEASVVALGNLLDALLDMSKLDAGAVTAEIADFPVSDILDRIEGSFRASALDKGLKFRVVHCSATVRSDPVLLERIVLNLVSNAIRYTAHGGVLVGCRRRDACIRIEVRDKGCGIPLDLQRDIFREFYQLPNPGRNGDPGMGLGLAIVDRLSRVLDHPVRVESTPGRGSVFAVEVPLGKPGQADARAEPIGAGIARGTLVALIDDNALARDSARGALEDWGCEVISATSLGEMLGRLDERGREPDVIISDYHLDGEETGIEAIAGVRAAHSAGIPGFLISGDTTPAVLQAAQSSGHVLLSKPVRPMKLRALLTHLMRTHESDRMTS